VWIVIPEFAKSIMNIIRQQLLSVSLTLACILAEDTPTAHSRVSRIKGLQKEYENLHKEVEGVEEAWNGRWFPEGHSGSSSYENTDPECDTGMTNLKTDWDNTTDLDQYLCLNEKYYELNLTVGPIIREHVIPPYYRAYHVCMDHKISYADDLPTFGPHRQVWAKYGEYKYLPAQRWIHNLEHGAVVMLYHPCAHPAIVQRLRNIVNSCLFRHVITPYRHLPPDRPIAVATWGRSLSMNFVSEKIVKEFIQNYATKAGNINADGVYEAQLKVPAKLVSDFSDSILCPDSEMYAGTNQWS